MYQGPDVILGMWQHLDINDWVVIGVLFWTVVYAIWGIWDD